MNHLVLFIWLFLFSHQGQAIGCGGNNQADTLHFDLSTLGHADLFMDRASALGMVKQKEISGIVCSQAHPKSIWGINDSGNAEMLYLYNSENANVRGVFRIKGAINYDWEDIGLGVGPKEGANYIYIADIGDNNAKRKSVCIYRFEEPNTLPSDSTMNILGPALDKLEFVYEYGPRDAEAMFLDPKTKNIYIITKRERIVGVYELAYPQNTSQIDTAKLVASLPITLVTASDMNAEGSLLLVKTYESIYIWKRKTGETICEMFTRIPERVNYNPIEPQGESICFGENGFFTLSEERFHIPPVLYYYSNQNR